MKPAYPLRIYADVACPLCRVEMQGLRARDPEGRLQVLDCSVEGFRDEDSEAAGFNRAQLVHRIHVRDAEGRWLVGVPAFAAAYEAVGLHWMARLLRLRGVQWLWSWGYGLIADYRWLLVRVGTPDFVAWLLRPAPTPSSTTADRRA